MVNNLNKNGIKGFALGAVTGAALLAGAVKVSRMLAYRRGKNDDDDFYNCGTK